MVIPRRLDVLLVRLDPTVGHEIQKTRPCVVISPDTMNQHLRTCIIAPLSTASRPGPSRVPCVVDGKAGFVVLDQLRSIDRDRIERRLGRLDEATGEQVLDLLGLLFAR